MNREEKSHAVWRNWHILEQVNREEKKDKTVSFRVAYKESMVRQFNNVDTQKAKNTLVTDRYIELAAVAYVFEVFFRAEADIAANLFWNFVQK